MSAVPDERILDFAGEDTNGLFLIISRQVASHRYDIKNVSGEWWVSGKVWW
jgi:hypothetical protein